MINRLIEMINSITISPETGFILQTPTTPFNVAPNTTATFIVKFAPTVALLHQSTVTVNSNATNSPSLQIPVSGTGVAPVVAPTCTLTADPTTINQGQSSTLTWTTTGNPTSASIDNGVGPVDPAGGNTTVTPAATTTYTLTVTNAAGSSNCPAAVTVNPPTGTQLTWTQRFPTTSPPARRSHSMAYDMIRGEVVLFGGSDSGGTFADTWVWDGTTWTQRFPATSPPARVFSAMAYDAARIQVVLFGGNAQTDTWVWDGVTWTQKIPVTSPAARSGHTIAYDAARNQVVLFGGDFSGDTWVWGQVAPSASFMKTFGSPGDDYVFSVQQTLDGGFIVAGTTSGLGAGGQDVLQVKFDGSGAIQWAKTAGSGSTDTALFVRQTSDGGYIVTGDTAFRLLVAKFDGAGAIQWASTLNNSPDSAAGVSVQETSDGGYIVTGNFGGLGGLGLLKYNGTGQLQWLRRVPGTNLYGTSVQQTGDSGYIVAGIVQGGFGVYDATLLKFDGTGNLQWSRLAGGSGYDNSVSVQQTSDGGYIVAGTTASFGAGGQDALLLKYDSLGTLQWARTAGGVGDDYADSVQQTSDGGYVISGRTNSFGTNTLLIKFDNSGTLQWAKAGGGSSSSMSVQQTSDGGYVVAGSTPSFGAGGSDVLLIRTDANGNIAGCADWSSVSPSIGTSFQSIPIGYSVDSPVFNISAGTLSVVSAPLTSNTQCIGGPLCSGIAIDFENFPGPDGQIGTTDDVPTPTNCQLGLCGLISDQYATLGVIFSPPETLFYDPNVTDPFFGNNHFLSTTSPGGAFSVPVFGVCITSKSFWTITLTALDAQGNVLATSVLPNPTPGQSPVLGVLSISTTQPIARFTVGDGNPDHIFNLDNLVFRTTP